MIVIKGVPRCEKEVLEAAKMDRNVSFNQQAPDDNMIYDITLKSDIQLITRKYGIELFNFDIPEVCHYMDECMFMEVIIR